MIENLKISFLQLSTLWENPIGNHRLIESYFPEKSSSQLILLSEMFSTGFTRDFQEKVPYESLEWLKHFAAKQNASVFGSVAVDDNGKSYNRGFWVSPKGEFQVYNKKHLFKYANEHLSFSAGNEILQTKIDNWSFRTNICYDLRFPVWSRNKAPFYDVLIYVASWPAVRSAAWKSLLKARAIENQAYVIGVNTVGEDGYGIQYSGDSCVIDFSGEVLIDAGNQEGRFDLELSYSELIKFRQNFPFLNDGDEWEFR